MAFVIEQGFEDAQHEYDREGDVLYISFGPPRPAVALTVEDWLVIRISPSPPHFCGFTIIGFKKIFSCIRPDLIQELPERIDRLKKARLHVVYSDETDTLTYRFEEEQPSYYERFFDNIYLERSLVGSEIVGFKITRYTEQGESAMEKLLSSIVEALFAAPGTAPGPADALTRAFLEHLDIGKLLSVAA
ncbi:MAG: hypothetical protein A3H27_18350 [Acidobacteria bacterium RIFCSPLOWO2_02_FULL_59_13]|nr:MAG: hypothetical protein A3H27_18350 [Acidobacteria bacterium RIFCSPLOWO2_02_FULL_59_13]